MRPAMMHRFRTRLPAFDIMTYTHPFSEWESKVVFVISRANIGDRCTFLTATRPFPAAMISRRDEPTRLFANPALPAQPAGAFFLKEPS